MFPKYTAVCKYIVNERRLLGGEHTACEATQNSQLSHLIGNISKSEPDFDDASALQEQLKFDNDDADLAL